MIDYETFLRHFRAAAHTVGTADYSAGGAGVGASTWQQTTRWWSRLSLVVAVERNRLAKVSVHCRTVWIETRSRRDNFLTRTLEY